MQTQVLLELQRIILQNACTKDVFRELDGFLVRLVTVSLHCEFLNDSDIGAYERIVHVTNDA